MQIILLNVIHILIIINMSQNICRIIITSKNMTKKWKIRYIWDKPESLCLIVMTIDPTIANNRMMDVIINQIE